MTHLEALVNEVIMASVLLQRVADNPKNVKRVARLCGEYGFKCDFMGDVSEFVDDFNDGETFVLTSENGDYSINYREQISISTRLGVAQIDSCEYSNVGELIADITRFCRAHDYECDIPYTLNEFLAADTALGITRSYKSYVDNE